MDTTVVVAIIGAIGVVTAAIIAGVFSLRKNRSAETHHFDSTSSNNKAVAPPTEKVPAAISVKHQKASNQSNIINVNGDKNDIKVGSNRK